jgi:hypothetical protein
MIYDNNCLFLFKRDLKRDLRNKVSVNDVDLQYFIKKNDDVNHFKDLVSKSKIVVYVDSERREIKHLQGPRKGHCDKF